jgi:hypothetical protein
MAQHIRTQLRNKFKEILKAQNIRTFNPIFGTLDEKNLPCVVIEILESVNNPGSITDTCERTFQVSLGIIHKNFEGVDEEIEQIMVKNEKALINDESLNGKIFPLHEKVKPSNEGDQSIRIVDQAFIVTFFTATDGCDEPIN